MDEVLIGTAPISEFRAARAPASPPVLGPGVADAPTAGTMPPGIAAGTTVGLRPELPRSDDDDEYDRAGITGFGAGLVVVGCGAGVVLTGAGLTDGVVD